MSSLPNPNHLTPNFNRRGHRHKRSQAMSGDFDAIGLGLFNSPSHIATNALASSSPPPPPIFSMSDDLDKHYQFNNTEDFSNNPNQGFAFPNTTSSGRLEPYSSSAPLSSKFNQHGPSNSLNSPIRLHQKRGFQNTSHFNNNPNQPKFFLTNETTVNKDNVPEALIDLDDIFKANLHINDNSNSGPLSKTAHFHKRTESAPANFYYDDFLGSPFIKENAIEEEEERLEVSFEDNEEDEEEDDDIRLHVNHGSDEALPPPSFYQSASANSSNSSLKTKTIEKTLSNSSSSSLFATPRSGAKASRYKNIYDQSKIISNAMKISSENVSGIERTVTPPLNRNNNSKYLNHSSSLPSLKGKRSFSHVPQLRYGDTKRVASPKTNITIDTPPTPAAGVAVSSSTGLSSSPSSKSPDTQFILELPSASTPSTSATTLSTSSNLELKKSRNSPTSVNSEALDSNTTSSTNSTVDTAASPSLAADITGNTTTPAIVVTNEQTQPDKDPLYINTNISSDNTTIEKSASTITPSSGNSTPLVDACVSPTAVVFPAQEDFEKKGTGPQSPTRPQSPAETRILNETRIPVFKRKSASKSSLTTPSLPSSSSSSTPEVGPTTSPPKPQYMNKHDFMHRSLFRRRGSNATDTSSVSSVSSRLKRTSRIFNWIRNK
ncbi:conserved hypothetical protein [Candida dubliniensis CD36]|uniref:Uncharacterized protein n=1 Tax=Candida dubliniensis (strain CD36 / ATCC MYA-646 / CBS 7987 / NCPF 3949 / NRRL Y-17841) TaxID=573826 RepID=B9WJD1_CANDC|nr:conserved hypothetical protein [Candida dubliniensis CD36]CAX41354.1 conserved hypothetical protein [Candida dubliniensis CD36]